MIERGTPDEGSLVAEDATETDRDAETGSPGSRATRIADINFESDGANEDYPPPLWALKGVVFWSAGTAACLLPFMAEYCDEAGLNQEQVGLITVIGALTSLIGIGGLSHFADKPEFGTPKVLLVATTVSSFGVVLMYTSSAMAHFGLLLTIWALTTFFLFGRTTLLDTLVIQQVRRYEGYSYGQIRVYGCFGWAILSPMTGFLVDAWGLGSTFAMFVFSSVCMAALLHIFFVDDEAPSARVVQRDESTVTVGGNDGRPAVTMPRLNLPEQAESSPGSSNVPQLEQLQQEEQPEENSNWCVRRLNGYFGNVFEQFDVRWVMVYLLFIGVMQTPGESFLYLYLLRRPFNPPPSEAILGLSAAIMSVAQIPIWFYAHRCWEIATKVQILTFCTVMLAVRFFLYALIPVAAVE